MSKIVNCDLGEAREFFEKLGTAAKGDFKKELEQFLDGLGNEFLRIVEDEIIRRKVVDTRLLLNSFHKGGDGSVWEITDDGLTLEVGTDVDYAGYVEDGHWTNPKGISKRFVPGRWENGRFIYEPGAKTGMLLRQKWVEGKHYFESAVRILDKMYPKFLESRLQDWLDRYFV